jgi:hypothetical protein
MSSDCGHRDVFLQPLALLTRQKWEWRMELAKKYLIAWIRGYKARVMYRAMKAEQVCLLAGPPRSLLVD